MADVKDILPDLAKLDAQLDDLEDALGPLLTTDLLTEQASQLPLLDKAKLFSLTAYAIESLLFGEPHLPACPPFLPILHYSHFSSNCCFFFFFPKRGRERGERETKKRNIADGFGGGGGAKNNSSSSLAGR